MAKSKNAHPDYILLSIISCLLLWGTLTVGTTSFPASIKIHGDTWRFLFHQLSMLSIGIVLGTIAFKISLKTLKKWAFILFIANLFVLLFVFVPKIGVELGGARRWISLGGFIIQPSEFLKISFMIYLAAWLSKDEKKTKFLLIPFFAILGILTLSLIFQPDMSTLGIICIAGISMYCSTKTPWWHSVLLIFSISGGAALLAKISPYRMNRVLVFLNKDIDPLGIGYQLNQSLIAIGSGRLFGINEGLALGMSRQKFGNLLPEAMTDSIFAIIGEELGFIGCIVLIALFLSFAWYGLKVYRKSNDNFARVLALGITAWITFQAFFNMGGVIGILPLAGIPLPFFSYGGSHLVAELIGVGILLNISKK